MILTHIAKGTLLSGKALAVLEEAGECLNRPCDSPDCPFVRDYLSQARNGELESLLFCEGETPVALICYDAIDDDANLAFGYSRYGKAKLLLELTLAELRENGFRSIRSNFLWPDPEAFKQAALDLGFRMIERKVMARNCDPDYAIRSLPAGYHIEPWSEKRFDAVAGLMALTADETDKLLYPLFSTAAGCRQLLRQILDGKYRDFLPMLSYVILADDRLAAYLMAVRNPDGVVTISDIAVDEASRGKGLASAMISHLIRDGPGQGITMLDLAVTSSNQSAIDLYTSKGYRVTRISRQHVYVR